MRNYKLLIAYEGTAYHGWQVQNHHRSIQQTIKEALSTLLQEPITLIGSSRTDSGVHALGQIAHFHTQKELIPYKALFSLNSMLPKDIRLLSLEEVPLSFHAQYSVKSKIYHYHLVTDAIILPFERLYAYHVKGKCDLERIKAALPYFIGTHDFSSFTNSITEGPASKNPVRSLYRLDLVTTPSGCRLEFEGNGFLYKMVRNITGTLLEVGAGKREPSEIPLILAAKDRRLAGKSAPPEGLFLMQINYL